MTPTALIQQLVQGPQAARILDQAGRVDRRRIQPHPGNVASLERAPEAVQFRRLPVQQIGRTDDQARLAHPLSELDGPGRPFGILELDRFLLQQGVYEHPVAHEQGVGCCFKAGHREEIEQIAVVTFHQAAPV